MSMKRVMMTVLGVVALASVAAADTITLTPTAYGDINSTGGTSYYYRNGGNVSTYWQSDSDNYAIIAEFDIDGYDSADLESATLTISMSPLFGVSNYPRLSQIASDLQVTVDDYNSSSQSVLFYPGAHYNNETVTIDITSILAAAMDEASSTQGIAFRLTEWTPTAMVGGCVVNSENFTITMTTVPEPATMAILAIGGSAVLFARKRRMGK